MLNVPSVIPTVVSYSSSILIVTLPVAPEITVMFTHATSPKVIFSTLTSTVDTTLLTLNSLELSATS